MIRHWLLAFRPKTLTAALVPVLVASAFAHLEGFTLSGWLLFCILGSALCIQIATNLFNDAIDFKKGADKTRVGPTRVTQSGLIGEKTVFAVAGGFCLLALALGIPLVMQGGWPLMIVGLSSLFLAYGYTGGPFPLAYLGLGDLFVILYFGLLAVGVSFFIFTGLWLPLSFLLGLQVGLLSAVLIALNNLRDAPLDAKVGKKTWAVQFGDRFVQLEITLFIVLSYLIQIFWVYHYGRSWFLIYLVTLPLAVKIVRITFTFQERAELIGCLGKSAGLHMLMGLSFILGSLL